MNTFNNVILLWVDSEFCFNCMYVGWNSFRTISSRKKQRLPATYIPSMEHANARIRRKHRSSILPFSCGTRVGSKLNSPYWQKSIQYSSLWNLTSFRLRHWRRHCFPQNHRRCRQSRIQHIPSFHGSSAFDNRIPCLGTNPS